MPATTRRSSPSRWSVDEYSLLPTLLIDALVISFAQVGELDRALALHERSGIHERMFALRPVAEAANEEEGGVVVMMVAFSIGGQAPSVSNPLYSVS